MAVPAPIADHGDVPPDFPGVVTRTAPAAAVEVLAARSEVVVVDDDVVVGDDVVLVETVVLVDGDGTTTPTVLVVSVLFDVVAVVAGDGEQTADASGLPVGGGSLGLPAPWGWNRQPSTTFACTLEPPGPTFEYSHEPVPCQYDQ